MGRERRRHPRKTVDLAAECELADGRRWSVTLDRMSIGGSFVATAEVQPFGTAMVLHFRLADRSAPLAIEAVVRWTSELGMGVQFGSLGGRATYELTEFLAKLPDDDGP